MTELIPIHMPSPILALWGQYQALNAACQAAEGDAFCQAAYVQMHGIERAMALIPCTTAAEVAAKYLIVSSFGDEEIHPAQADTFKAEMMAMAGGAM